jgi:predicted amidohydrolase
MQLKVRLLAKARLKPYAGPMNVLAVQMDIVWENKSANLETVRRLLRQSSIPAESLIMLPEMFATGFSLNPETAAEPYGGETEQSLSRIAKELSVYLVGGAAMRSGKGKSRNKALIFGPTGDLIAFYSKMRPFSLSGEGNHYQAGQKPTTFRWHDCTVAPFICYDLRFPELFREAALTHKPELYVVIANWPDKRIAHWVRLLQARAIENQAYVVGVNRVGSDPSYVYSGRSVIVDYNGEIVSDAGSKEGIIQGRLDLESLIKYRQGLPFLQDLVPWNQNPTA